MRVPITTQQQRDWLETHFGPVTSVQRSPQTIISTLGNTLVAMGDTRSPLSYNGKDIAQSISRLFEGVTDHGGSEHLVKLDKDGAEEHVWVHTADNVPTVRAWNPPVAAAA